MAWSEITTWLQGNHLASGGLVLLLGGYVLVILRNLPKILGEIFLRQFTIVIETRNSDEVFYWIQAWLDDSGYGRKTRRVTVSTRTGRFDETNFPEMIFSPSPGIHWIRYKGKIMLLTRTRTETTDGMGGGSVFSNVAVESFSIRTLGRSQRVVHSLMSEIRQNMMMGRKDKVTIYLPDAGFTAQWKMAVIEDKKPLESVVLADHMMGRLTDDIEKFTKQKDWYNDIGIPYRRGYLLHGSPGNGKSSIVKALASHFNMDIYCIALSSITLGDTKLMSLFSLVPEGNILLIEDIDALMNVNREQEDKEDPSLMSVGKNSVAGLLNVIDGAIAPEGRILFMTTNHVDKLDAALVRAGRVDRDFNIDNATSTQAKKLFSRFMPSSTDIEKERFGACLAPATMMAAIQDILMTHRNNPKDAIAALREHDPNKLKHKYGIEEVK